MSYSVWKFEALGDTFWRYDMDTIEEAGKLSGVSKGNQMTQLVILHRFCLYVLRKCVHISEFLSNLLTVY